MKHDIVVVHPERVSSKALLFSNCPEKANGSPSLEKNNSRNYFVETLLLN